MMITDTTQGRTQQFKNKYLIAGGTGRGYGAYKMVADSSGTNKMEIASAIRDMSYGDFMHTIYWRLIALQVKSDAGWRCSECGCRGNLDVHHEDYRLHGYEMYHLDGLKCLCKKCHKKRHKK